MPILKNYSSQSKIEWEIKLHNGRGFTYNKELADYLNWIPYHFRLTVDNKTYIMNNKSFSLEGLKCFISKMQSSVDERTRNRSYTHYYYVGPENEFEFRFRNTDDYYEEHIMLIELWLNTACLDEILSDYSLGFKFIIKYKDLEEFLVNLKFQLHELIDDKIVN